MAVHEFLTVLITAWRRELTEDQDNSGSAYSEIKGSIEPDEDIAAALIDAKNMSSVAIRTGKESDLASANEAIDNLVVLLESATPNSRLIALRMV